MTAPPPTLDTSPAELPSKDIRLVGKHVTITALTIDHAAPLYEQTKGPENDKLWLHLFNGPFDTLEDFTADTCTAVASNDPLHYAITLNNTAQTPVGRLSLMRIDARNRVCEVGHVLFGPLLQRTPAATEALYLLGRYVFEDLRYRRWEWKCNSRNEASRRAALRFGFVYEGLFRQHMFQRGQNRDTWWASMLDGEWEERKRGLELWLDGGNFDEDGKQRKKLEEFKEGRDG